MSWCRLEDDMDENRKLRRLSHEAFRLYWVAVTYARRQQTSGRLHLDDIRDLAARHRIKNVKAAITDLVYVPVEYGFEHGCWEMVAPGVYQVHDHEEYNPPTSRERMRAKRARDRASQGGDGDDDVTSQPVTSDGPRDGSGDGGVTHSDTPRAQERAGYPDPVPEPVVPIGTPDPVPRLPPQPLQPPPPVTLMPLSPEVRGRVQELEEACSEFLVRPLRGTERDLVLAWASRLRRGGELVPVAEIMAVVRRKMLIPTPDGSLPANLAWCADDVAALARTPIDPEAAVEDWRQLSERARSYGDVTG